MKKNMQRIVVMVLAFALVFGGVPLRAAASAAEGVATDEYALAIAPISASLTGSGAAGDPWMLSTIECLQWMAANHYVESIPGFPAPVTPPRADRHFELANDIGTPAEPVDFMLSGISLPEIFQGNFNGNSFTITVDIDDPSENDDVGLFRQIGGWGVVQNVTIAGSVCGNDRVGGLAGSVIVRATIENVHSEVNVTATGSIVGGLIGGNATTVRDSSASGTVSGVSFVGGLVGATNATGRVENSRASGNVFGSVGSIGGLVGENNGVITNSFATGTVSGTGMVGSFSVGGLVGFNFDGTITNAYAIGNVTSEGGRTGGLVGYAWNDSAISNTYATGIVNGGTQVDVGGLVGGNGANISSSVALNPDIIATGIIGRIWSGDGGGAGAFNRASAAVQINGEPFTGIGTQTNNQGESESPATIATEAFWRDEMGWDFDDVWIWCDTAQLPILRGFPGVVQNPQAPGAQAADIFRIGAEGAPGVQYFSNLQDAVDAAPEGIPLGGATTTIYVLQNHTHYNTTVNVIAGRNITLDLGGHTLAIYIEETAPTPGVIHALQVNTGTGVGFTGDGAFRVTSHRGHGAVADGSASYAVVSHAAAFGSAAHGSNRGAVVTNGGFVTVAEDVTAGGVSAFTGNIFVGGDVSASGDSSVGALADVGATVTVAGDVSASGSLSVGAWGMGGTVNVGGDVTATGTDSLGALATGGGRVNVYGTPSGGYSPVALGVPPRIYRELNNPDRITNGFMYFEDNAENIVRVRTDLTPATFTGVTANGTSEITTTGELTLSFDTIPSTLANITVTVGGTDLTVTSLGGTGNSHTVGISGYWTNGATATVSVASPAGYHVFGSPQTVVLHRMLTLDPANLVGITPPEPVGRSFAQAEAGEWGLPATVNILLDSGETVAAAVSWQAPTGFDPTATTTQAAISVGTIVLPEGITNTDDISLSVSIEINIAEPDDPYEPTPPPEPPVTPTPPTTPEPPAEPEPPVTRPSGGGSDHPSSNPGLPPLQPRAARPAQAIADAADDVALDLGDPAPREDDIDEADIHRIHLLLQIGSFQIICLITDDITQMDVAPVIVNGRTLVPVRFIAEALNTTVAWNETTREVTLTLDGESLTFAIGETASGMDRFGQSAPDIPAQIIDNRTMVPLRFISEFFGATVKWDEETRRIEILK